jgi:hypothetical protein
VDGDTVSGDAALVNWRASADDGMHTSIYVGGAWWNALVQDPLSPRDDFGQASGFTIKRAN